MKLPINWLREFVNIEETPAQLADIFTSLGFGAEVISEKLLDVEITPNRGDCLSILGLAREYAAFKNKSLHQKNYDIEFLDQSTTLKILADGKQCYRYSGIVLENAALKPSSETIKERLISVGITPHNAIVDLTNYVMIETGQPLHAFDLDEIKGKKLTIRPAKKGESLKILTGQILKLNENALIIEDGNGVIDLAGIMGGQNASVSQKTKRVFLQAATFDPKIIRKSAKNTKVSTEASHRYERYVDHALAPKALALALEIINRDELGSPKELFDTTFKQLREKSVELTYQGINETLGLRLDPKLVKNYLQRLGFSVHDISPSAVKIIVPSHRFADIFIEQDLIEEIARLHGYSRIGRRPIGRSEHKVNNSYQLKRSIIETLSTHGIQQIITYTLVAQAHLIAAGYKQKDLLTLENPISPEQSVFRPSLLIGALKTIQKNSWWPNTQVFEIGNVCKQNVLFEHVIIAGTPKIDKRITKIFSNLPVITITPDMPIAKILKLRQNVEIIEEKIEDFKQVTKNEKLYSRFQLPRVNYRPISTFPPIIRDISIIVANEIKSTDIIKVIKAISPVILLAELFDEFSSEKFGKNKKSLAFHIVFDDPSKTMLDTEAEEFMKKIASELKTQFDVKLR